MRKKFTKYNDICRYGGDEFVVIFKNCTMDQTVKRIEQIRELIAENYVLFNGNEISTTMSAGLSTITNEIKCEKVIESADRKLYQVKKKVRNPTEFMEIVE